MLDQNLKLFILVIGIEILSLSLELAPVVAHTWYVPSSFAAHLALQHLNAVTRLAREGATHLEAIAPATIETASGKADDTDAAAPLPTDVAPDQSPTPPPLPPGDPPKRKRGRPPKAQPFLNGHDTSSPLT